MVGMYCISCLDIARTVVHVNVPPVSKRNMLFGAATEVREKLVLRSIYLSGVWNDSNPDLHHPVST